MKKYTVEEFNGYGWDVTEFDTREKAERYFKDNVYRTMSGNDFYLKENGKVIRQSIYE